MAKYTFFSKAILRTPALPLPTSPTISEIKTLLNRDDYFLNALYIAAPLIVERLKKYGIGHDSKEGKKLDLTLLSYLGRMKTRSTPFGLFAGCSVLKKGENLDLTIPNYKNYQPHANLNMKVFYDLNTLFRSDLEIKKSAKYYPNQTLYSTGEKFRFMEEKLTGEDFEFNISSAEKDDALELILKSAEGGATLDEIAESVQRKFSDFSKIEILDFLEELVTEQILLSNFRPETTGDNALKELIKKVEPVLDTSPATTALKKLAATVESINSKKSFSKSEIKQLSDSIHSNFEIKTQHPLAIDLYKDSPTAEIPHNVFRDLSRIIEFLQPLDINKDTSANLVSFVERFSKRYENQEVPLLEALDFETGVGYADLNRSALNLNTFLGFAIPNESDEKNYSLSPNQDFLQKELLTGKYNFECPLDLKKLSFPKKNLELVKGDSLAALFTLRKGDNSQPQIIFNATAGPSALGILGRFANTNSDIKEMGLEIAEQEQSLYQNDTILAEINHLPDARAGNIVYRPRFRKYEIPIFTSSSALRENQISLSDLTVSVLEGKIFLRSKKLGKRIIPRRSNAQNYSASPFPIYRFLSDLQYQNRQSTIYFKWELLPFELSQYPRVMFGKHILCPATWILNQDDFPKTTIELGFEKSMKMWREKFGLPRYFSIATGEIELCIDAENSDAQELFFQKIKNTSSLVLKEFLQKPEKLIVKDPEGNRYANEIVSIYQANGSGYLGGMPSLPKPEQKVKRTFPPFSEWVYFKIYCAPLSADKILQESVLPLITTLEEEGILNNWFFIRYADPDEHLRLRIRLNRISDFQTVVSQVADMLAPRVDSKEVYNWELATYQRELERYGFENIRQVEQLFSNDSLAVLRFLALSSEMSWEDSDRYIFILFSIDRLLNDFGMESEEKLIIIGKLCDSFNREFRFDKIIKKQISKEFMAIKEQLNLLEKPQNHSESFEIQEKILSTRTEQNIKATEAILKNYAGNTEELHRLICSCIHMICNRGFPDMQRAYEFGLYNFMKKYYKVVRGEKMLVS